MFRVYDYTDATRLFGQAFMSRYRPVPEPSGSGEPEDDVSRDPTVRVEGFDVRVTPAGQEVITLIDGNTVKVTVDEYKRQLAAKIIAEVRSVEQLRRLWLAPKARKEFLTVLPDRGRSALLVQQLDGMEDYDLYDVLAHLGFNASPRTRVERADVFEYRNEAWLSRFPGGAASTIKALARQFAQGGIDALESREVFHAPDVVSAGGLTALKQAGDPAEALRETKDRLLAA
jgi:type I restriction enzyme R subunit